MIYGKGNYFLIKDALEFTDVMSMIRFSLTLVLNNLLIVMPFQPLSHDIYTCKSQLICRRKGQTRKYQN